MEIPLNMRAWAAGMHLEFGWILHETEVCRSSLKVAPHSDLVCRIARGQTCNHPKKKHRRTAATVPHAGQGSCNDVTRDTRAFF